MCALGSEEWQLFAVVLGMVYAVLLMPGVFGAALLYYRKLEGPAAAAELPHLVILIAPYALVLSTWLAASPQLLPASTTHVVAVASAVAVGAAVCVVSAQLPRVVRLPLTASSGSYTFPTATLGVCVVRWIAQGTDGMQRSLTDAEIRVCWSAVR
jgi:hypothetical protein